MNTFDMTGAALTAGDVVAVFTEDDGTSRNLVFARVNKLVDSDHFDGVVIGKASTVSYESFTFRSDSAVLLPNAHHTVGVREPLGCLIYVLSYATQEVCISTLVDNPKNRSSLELESPDFEAVRIHDNEVETVFDDEFICVKSNVGVPARWEEFFISFGDNSTYVKGENYSQADTFDLTYYAQPEIQVKT